MLRPPALLTLAALCLAAPPLLAQDSTSGGVIVNTQQLNALAAKMAGIPAPTDQNGMPVPQGAKVPMEAIASAFAKNTDAGDLSLAFVRFETFWQNNYPGWPVEVLLRPAQVYTFLTRLDVFIPVTFHGTGEVDLLGFQPGQTTLNAQPVMYFPNAAGSASTTGGGIKTYYVGSYQPNLAAGSYLGMYGVEVRGPGKVGCGIVGTDWTQAGLYLQSTYSLHNVVVNGFPCDGIYINSTLNDSGVGNLNIIDIPFHIASGTQLTVNVAGQSISATAASTDTGTLDALVSAINAVWAGSASRTGPGGGPAVRIEYALSNTTYTLTVDGSAATFTTPVDPGNTPFALPAQNIVTNLIASINAIIGAGQATMGGYDVIQIPAGHTVSLGTGASALMSVGGVFVNSTVAMNPSRGAFAFSGTNLLRYTYYSNTINSSTYRVHTVGNGRHGINVRGSATGQTVNYHFDSQNNGNTQILDEGLVGSVWIGVHTAIGGTAANTCSIATGNSSGSAGPTFVAPYVEGTNGNFINSGSFLGGKPAQIDPTSVGGVDIRNDAVGFETSQHAIRGIGGGLISGNQVYAYIGDPTNTTSAEAFGANNVGALFDHHLLFELLAAGFWDYTIGTATNRVYERVSHNNNLRQGPGEIQFTRGLYWGGLNEPNGWGATPDRRLFALTQGGLDCAAWGEQEGNVNTFSNANPPLVQTTLSSARTPQAGQRVWIENVQGPSPANGMWRSDAGGSGQFHLLNFDGTSQAPVGSYVANTGIAVIIRLECWTNQTITSPSSLAVGISGGQWAVGDVIRQAIPTTGGPSYWLVTAAGLGSAGPTFTASNQVALQPAAVALSNFAAGGSIGTAATTVDLSSSITVNQTTAAQALTIPSPTTTTNSRWLIVTNVGSASFTISSAAGGGASVTINAGTASGSNHTFVWDGTTWRS